MRTSILSTGILIAVISLMMIISPETCMKLVVIILGIGGVLNGIYNLISVRKFVADTNFKRIIAIRGVLSILVGLVATFLPFLVTGILDAMLYMLAIYLIISAAMEMVSTFRMKQEGLPTKMFTIEIIASLVLALILFAIPATIGLIIRIMGIILLVVSIAVILWGWRNKSANVTAERVVVKDIDLEEDE